MIPKHNILSGLRNQKIARVFHKSSPKSPPSLPSLFPLQLSSDPDIFSISPEDLFSRISRKETLLIIDLRDRSDYLQCYLLFPASLNLPFSTLPLKTLNDSIISALLSDTDKITFELRFKVGFVVVVDYRGEDLGLVVRVALGITKYSGRDCACRVGYLVGGIRDFGDLFGGMMSAPLRATVGFAQNKYASADVAAKVKENDFGAKVVSNGFEETNDKNASKMDLTLKLPIQPKVAPSYLTLPPKLDKPTSPKEKKMPKSEDNIKLPIQSQVGPSYSTLPAKLDKQTFLKNTDKKAPTSESNSPARLLPQVDPLQKNQVDPPQKDEKKNPKRSSSLKKITNPLKTHSRQSSTDLPRGLRNIGNTCFMNAVIQSLRGVSRLSHYFLAEKYKKDINPDNKQGFGGELAHLYHSLLQSLYLNRDTSAADLRDFTAAHSPSYIKGQQHDAHEFLHFLLDCLHEDLNKGCKVPPKKVARKEDQIWRDHLEASQSIVSDCFQGLLRSTIRCLTCSGESSTFEVFVSIGLPIPEKSDCTLEDCFDELRRVEQVFGIFCEQCQGVRDFEKEVGVWRFPPTLILFFVRFVHSEGRARRKDTLVKFPREMSPACLDGGVPHYSLMGVVNHAGTINCGHYTCDVLREGQWMTFDDLDVRRIQGPAITKSAYILFYDCRSDSFI